MRGFDIINIIVGSQKKSIIVVPQQNNCCTPKKKLNKKAGPKCCYCIKYRVWTGSRFKLRISFPAFTVRGRELMRDIPLIKYRDLNPWSTCGAVRRFAGVMTALERPARGATVLAWLLLLFRCQLLESHNKQGLIKI
jgi:hypothetical protein